MYFEALNNLFQLYHRDKFYRCRNLENLEITWIWQTVSHHVVQYISPHVGIKQTILGIDKLLLHMPHSDNTKCSHHTHASIRWHKMFSSHPCLYQMTQNVLITPMPLSDDIKCSHHTHASIRWHKIFFVIWNTTLNNCPQFSYDEKWK